MFDHRAPERAEDSDNFLIGADIGAAINVHRALGPGLLEGIYSQCLGIELDKRGVDFESEVPVPVSYDGLRLRTRFRVDLLVGKLLVVELKAVPHLLPLHTAQVLTYLTLTGCHLGLPINSTSKSSSAECDESSTARPSPLCAPRLCGQPDVAPA